jgi:hypothetical protein
VATEKEYQRALETARILVTTHLEDEDALRSQVLLALRGATRLSVANLVEVLVIAVGNTFDSLDDWSEAVVTALADQYRAPGGDDA